MNLLYPPRNSALLQGLRRAVGRGIAMKTRFTVQVEVKVNMAAIAHAIALIVWILA